MTANAVVVAGLIRIYKEVGRATDGFVGSLSPQDKILLEVHRERIRDNIRKLMMDRI